MATVIVEAGYTFDNSTDASRSTDEITIVSVSTSLVVLQDSTSYDRYTGSFEVTSLTVTGISGTVTGYQQLALDGTVQLTVSGLSVTWSVSLLAAHIPATVYSGDDSVVGVYGGQDDDLIYGNTGDDVLFGNRGNDTIYGGQDDDLVYGNTGRDRLFGNRGHDTVYGGQDDDLIYGNQDADTLYGNLGADKIYGGQGDDVLNGGGGNDWLAGGLGNDTFGVGSGHDTVADLDIAVDRIQTDITRVSAVSTVTLLGVQAGSVSDTLFV